MSAQDAPVERAKDSVVEAARRFIRWERNGNRDEVQDALQLLQDAVQAYDEFHRPKGASVVTTQGGDARSDAGGR